MSLTTAVRLSRTLLAAGLLVSIAAPLGAPVAAESPSPTPALTFAPLVTLPPLVAPSNPTPAGIAVDGYTMGSPDAPVEIQVWEDFQCPYCRRWTQQIEPLIVSQLVQTGLVRLTYRPLAFLGEESRWAAVAADLAAEQGRFWPMQDLLFANQLGENIGTFSLDRILGMAEAAGLDMDVFRRGLVLDAARERFARLQQASAIDASMLGISATPSVVVNGSLLPTPDYETIVAAVQAALPAATTEPSPAATTSGAPVIPEASPAG